MWLKEEPTKGGSPLPCGFSSKIFGTVIGILHESKEKQLNGVQLIGDLTKKWAIESKSPGDNQPDPMNGIYFGVSVFAHYIGYITLQGEKLSEETNSKAVISNDRVAEISREFMKRVVTFKTSLELSGIDMVGILSILISETASCRGRRWHDLDFINKMIDANVTLTPTEQEKNKMEFRIPKMMQKQSTQGPINLNLAEHRLLNKLISNKFSILNAIKGMFPRWKE